MSDSVITGTNSGDSIDGSTDSNIINSGAGNDTIDGGGGDDRLNSGSGADTLIYRLSENLTFAGTTDLYTGGSGVDTVQLVFTREEWASQEVQDQINAYLTHLAAATNPTTGEVSNGSASDFTFVFEITGESSTLTVSMIENVEWVVLDNIAPALTDAQATLEEGTEDAAYTIYANDLLQGYSDADGDLLSISGLTSDTGTLVDNDNGTWTFTPAEDFSGEVTLSYTVVDGIGGSAPATQSFNVAAVADQPALFVEDASGTGGNAINLAIDADLTDTDGSESLSVTIFAVPDGWILSAGTLLNPDTGTYVLSSSDLVGLTITPPADTLPGEITLSVTATATEGSSLDAESINGSLSVTVNAPEGVDVVSGEVVDGYIAGATVFSDADNDGELDAGEIRATTDANGGFTLIGADPGDPLVMFGGTDVSTGLAFEGVLRAPEGSTVITPLTTLMAELIDSGAAADPTEAQDLVKAAFGLSETIDLSSFDPVQETIGETAGAAEVLAAGIQVQNAIVQVTALLGSEGAGAGDQAAADAAVASLAGLIVTAAGGTVDLALDATVEDLIGDSADAVAVVVDTAVISAAAEVLSAANTAIDDAVTGGGGGDATALLTDIAQVAAVAQGDAVVDDLAQAGADDLPGTIVDDYTGTNLETQVDNAEVGDVDGGLNGSIGNDILTGSAGNDAIDGLAGNDLLNGAGGNDTLYGSSGHDTLQGGPGDDVLNGGILANYYTVESFSDTDRADYSTAAGPVDVNLGTGIVSDDGDGGSDQLIGIEGVVGSAGADTITGSAAFFEFYIGGAGNDTINGGFGNDRALYTAASGAISVTLGSMNPAAPTPNGLVTGDASVGSDTLIDVEQVYGTAYPDTYVASGFLSASGTSGLLSTFNRFEGDGGNDTITGNGNTGISYQSALEPVTVTLVSATAGVGGSTGTALGGASVGTDTFTGVSQVRGSAFGDSFSGGTATTSQLYEGNGGDDIINGGNGFDTARYAFDGAISTGLSVNMAAGIVTGDSILTGTDTLLSVEGVQGSILADVYDATGYGSGSNIGNFGTFNEFEGMAGDDTIIGNGNTRVIYINAREGVTVDLDSGNVTNAAGVVMIGGIATVGSNVVVGSATSAGSSVGTDTINGGAAQIRGSNFSDSLTGLNNVGPGNAFVYVELFQGRGGNDTIDGAGGYNQATYNEDPTSAGITVNMAAINASTGTVIGDSAIGVDTLIGILAVRGTIFDDTYVAGAFGFSTGIPGLSAGFNEFEGDGGNDSITGNGNTRVSFFNSTGVSVTMTAPGTGTGTVVPLTNVDTFTGAAVVRGSEVFGDTFDSTALSIGANFEGRGGNDTFKGGTGVDFFNGGNGSDRMDYSSSAGAVTVNLATFTAPDGFSSIEEVTGSANNDSITGDGTANRLDGGAGADSLSAAGGNDTLIGGAGNDTLDGGLGTDLADYSSSTGAVNVNLSTGSASDGLLGTDSLSGIEDVTGSSFNDSITGDTANNRLQGGQGNDNLIGNAGNDTLDGGIVADFYTVASFLDVDTANYGGAAGAVTVNLATGVASDGSGGTDQLIGVEGARGSASDDTITGSSAFFEFFFGGAGNDTINGGLGNDRADYNNAPGTTTGITVNLTAGTVVGDASIGSDILIGVEQIRGTIFVDTYSAVGFVSPSQPGGVNSTFNEFEGFGGNDTITGNGDTRINYSSATGSVNVNLVSGTAIGDGSVGTDTFSGVNRVRGSAGADTLTGGLAANDAFEAFEGRGGNDTINGGSGFDVAAYGFDGAISIGLTINLAAGTVSGDPVLTGSDTLQGIGGIQGSILSDFYDATGFSGSSTNAGSFGTLNEFEGMAGNDTIIGNGDTRISYVSAREGVAVDLDAGMATGGASVGTDTFTGVNAVRGSNFGDTIDGGAGGESLFGRAGADMLSGGDGNDTLIGGIGADIINADGTGIDTIVFNSMNEAGDTLNSFNAGAGGDVLKISDLLDVSTDYADGAGGALSNYVRVDPSGGDGLLQIDTDGAGVGATWQTLATITGGSLLTLLDLQTNNNIVV